MKIAFIHYHLKPGGVTTVLRQQVEVARKFGSSLVLTGELSAVPFSGKTVLIPGLGYDDDCMEKQKPEVTAEAVAAAIFGRWKEGCDIIHVHNPLLAKNKEFLSILKILQKRGFRLFLQVHDFAEDGRLRSYYAEAYPADCHYGVINSRDYGILLDSGLKPSGIHLLANAFEYPNLNPAHLTTGHRVVYPVRAIRRKNIGEAILLSSFFKGNEELALTLPPNSPSDMKNYQGWRQFTAKNGLPVQFETGLSESFEKLIQSAKFILTTSISEGFGFSFLEAWTNHKLLWGRILPDICKDFEQNGIKLDHLYHELKIPLELIDRETFFQKWDNCLKRVCRHFEYHLGESTLIHAFESMTAGDSVDFGLLDELLQKQVIDEIIRDKNQKRRLIEMNPFLETPGVVKGENARVDHNRKKVVEQYNKRKYSDTLLKIYQSVMNRSVQHQIDKKRVLSRFLNPFHFSLLKWSDDE